ncbi:hypothetical protein M218_11435 [Burkholderia pseudomallei MSHR338]|nr:hypothetical protein M218_11435 [Burkholderia pseudomallei MSHR338]
MPGRDGPEQIEARAKEVEAQRLVFTQLRQGPSKLVQQVGIERT